MSKTSCTDHNELLNETNDSGLIDNVLEGGDFIERLEDLI